jgi:hypothetical protein
MQLRLWTSESIPMKMLEQYIIVRWQSKAGMLDSLNVNKDTVRNMCASDDDECKALQDHDLSDAEWAILEDSLCFAICRQRHLSSFIILVRFCLGSSSYFQGTSSSHQIYGRRELCSFFFCMECSVQN